MSYSPKSIIMFVLVLSFFSFFPATSVTQSFAQNSERISISVSNSSFVPLTNTDANQVRVGVEYTIEDESIENEMINAVMKVYAPNGSLIRTTSIPSGFTAQSGGGVEVLKTTFLDKSMQSILANITFTDLTKKVLVSNVIAVNLDLEEPPASTATTTTNSSSLEN
ncbi:MAG: hypothetical protein QOK88_00875 [Nitrososphaeraceae archaeon]|jgi:hypothetical protein|nr:hypothetical protein [Nitrososphaeraceae archaeon]MDW0154852.1 hypothetical protein [Nitrososphaeraceae archaeon]RPI81610.1 MAG: hypothetical protein EHM34_08350 [Nitrosopumilales archaeon]